MTFLTSFLYFERQVRVITQTNRGLSAARNAGLDATDSDLVAYLDADDAWHPDKLRRQVEYLAQPPMCRLVHTAVTYIDQHGGPLPKDPVSCPPPTGQCLAELLRCNGIMISSVLHSRANDVSRSTCRPQGTGISGFAWPSVVNSPSWTNH